MIPYGKQDITQDDIDAVIEVLKSDFLTQGPMIPEFEKCVAEYCQALHGVAFNSATSALHVACLSLGLGPGDYLWTSPNTFVASANCGVYCGAAIDFVDIDPHTYNISVEALSEKLKRADHSGELPKVLIPVHFAGQSCQMREIRQLTDKYGVRVIEDASHAIGGEYLAGKIGSCRYSDITIFSFHPVKIITTGEGGMALTNDPVLAERMARLRSHGITRDQARMSGVSDGPWYYEQLELGFNYRMTDIQAALGYSQMARIDQYISKRRSLAHRYDSLLSDLPIGTPWQHPDTRSAYHLYPIKISEIVPGRSSIFAALRKNNIGVNVHYIPVHMQPFYRNMRFRTGDFPVSEEYYARAISLPLYPGLTEDQQDYIVSALADALV